ncbi:MAG: NAD(P)H-dependent oxidoreductase [Gemmatimonadaceae bacterium]
MSCALFFCWGLSRKSRFSPTQALCEVVAEVLLKQEGVRSEIVRLRDYDIQAGTQIEIDKDDWPKIVEKMKRADIVIFATPVWWGIQSSYSSERSNVWMSSTTSSLKPANQFSTTRSVATSRPNDLTWQRSDFMSDATHPSVELRPEGRGLATGLLQRVSAAVTAHGLK